MRVVGCNLRQRMVHGGLAASIIGEGLSDWRCVVNEVSSRCLIAGQHLIKTCKNRECSVPVRYLLTQFMNLFYVKMQAEDNV